MERPKIKNEIKKREVTGEILYLDEMRRLNQRVVDYLELSDVAIQMYKTESGLYRDGQRPQIMEEYERFDAKRSDVVASCAALADELLSLKEADSTLTFVDIAVEARPEEVIRRLNTLRINDIIANPDEQLAIPSNGEYYPVLDIQKQNAQLVSVGLRAWGWEDEKYVFTNEADEPYRFPEHLLKYPSEEKSSTRKLELSFGYSDKESGGFSESISLYMSSNGAASITSSVWAEAYAETGYEGHGQKSFDDAQDADVAALGDLIAEIVGDEPLSVSMKIDHQLNELSERALTEDAKQAVSELIQVTWPAQARYVLYRKEKNQSQSIARQLNDPSEVDFAVARIRAYIDAWIMKTKSI